MMTRYAGMMLAAAVMAACAAGFSTPAFAQVGAATQEQLLATLKSEGELPARWEAARLLARTATPAAAPELAGLLADEKIADLARHVLESMADPAADEALRTALPGLKGKALVGAVQSLGARRDAKAVEPLAKLLGGSDAAAATAATISLGQIANAEAGAALAGAEAQAAGPMKIVIQDAILRCADAALEQGRAEQAVATYDRLRAGAASNAVKMAALRGAIVARGEAGVELLLACVAGEDWLAVNVALRTAAHELSGAKATQALATGLAKLAPERQAVLVTALGHRGDAAATDALAAAARSDNKAVKVAAYEALARLAQPAALPVLMEGSASADKDIAAAAQQALLAMPDKQTDAAILALLDEPTPARRTMGITLAHRRMMKPALPALLKAAGADETEPRSAALKALAELAGPGELPALLDLLGGSLDGADRDQAERAAALVCLRADKVEPCVDVCVARFQQAKPDQKSSLIRVLRAVGGGKALAAVKSAMNDPATGEAAIRAITGWPDASAADDLAELAKSAPQANHRMLAFRGLLRLADHDKDNPPAQMQLISRARQLAATAETRRLVLASLANVRAVEAMEQAAAIAKDDAEVRAEAILAAIKVGESLAQNKPAAVKKTMQELEALTGDEALKGQIRDVIASAASAPVNVRTFLRPDPARSEATAKELARKAPEGFALAWYLDCGPETQAGKAGSPQVRIAQGRPHIWPVNPGRNNARFLTCTYWEQKVVFELTGLKADKKYVVGVAWWDVDGNTRKASLWAVPAAAGTDAKEACVVKTAPMPSWSSARQGPAELSGPLPPELTRAGTLKLEAREDGPPNVVVSELWLYESK